MVHLSFAGWVVVGLAAAALVALTLSRSLRRLVVTGWVGWKVALGWMWTRLTGRLERRPAILRRAFEELGPTYIKLGQLVASSQGLFPEPYCVEFQKCLDRVRPVPFPAAARVIAGELGRPPAEVFASIDETPLASASIAQVHAARLADGTEVVLKVQRPAIDRAVADDLSIMKRVARLLARSPRAELANPVGIVEDFESNLREELDFVLEAGNMDRFNAIMAEHGHAGKVAAPRVHHDLTSRRLLVMERFVGHRVDDLEQVKKRNLDGEANLLLGMRAWFQCMIFHGFFHGDVHAGNLMSLLDGRIGFLDFGIVGRFTPEKRIQVTDYLLAFSSGDFRHLAQVMVAMGSIGDRPAGLDLTALAADLEVAYGPLLGSALGGIKYADLLPGILRTSVKHRMRMPRDFVLITKQMLYFDRYAKLLAPNLNIFRDPRVVSALAEDVFAARLRDQAAAQVAAGSA
jgi:predicted unusual protein kinase regulating ubiquinone biosynthesis (AarF/ABC1/UbiB family)